MLVKANSIQLEHCYDLMVSLTQLVQLFLHNNISLCSFVCFLYFSIFPFWNTVHYVRDYMQSLYWEYFPIHGRSSTWCMSIKWCSGCILAAECWVWSSNPVIIWLEQSMHLSCDLCNMNTYDSIMHIHNVVAPIPHRISIMCLEKTFLHDGTWCDNVIMVRVRCLPRRD